MPTTEFIVPDSQTALACAGVLLAAHSGLTQYAESKGYRTGPLTEADAYALGTDEGRIRTALHRVQYALDLLAGARKLSETTRSMIG